MKNIEQARLQQLLEIIQPAPMQRIGHFSDGGQMMIEALSEFCKDKEYEYILNCTNEDFYNGSADAYNNKEWVKIKNFDLNRRSYLLHGKVYEYLFVSSVIPIESRESFLQKSHKSIKNAGLIILFVPKNDYAQIEEWSRLLEANYYVATNTIDIFENYELIVSKKMHGWGG